MKYLIITGLTISLISCSSRSDRKAESNSSKGADSSMADEVALSDEQFMSIGIQLGSIETRSISGSIKAHGVLDVPPQNLVSISAPLGGFVKFTELLQSMRVKKG